MMRLSSDCRNLVEVLGRPEITRSFDEARWSALVASARATNLLGALATRLRSALIPVPATALRHLDGHVQLGLRQRQSVVWEVHQLQRTLAGLGAPVLLLKGAAYVMAHPFVAEGRTFGDIDILAPRLAIGDAESLLMLGGWVSAKTDAYDQRYYREWMHEVPPMVHVHRGTVLDLHHTILPLTARNAPDPAKIIDRAIGLPGIDGVRVPCPEDLVIHSITHLVHEGELSNGLRDLQDIDVMLRRFGQTDGFWTRLSDYASGNDLARPVALGLQLVRSVFGTTIPAEVSSSLAKGEQPKAMSRWLAWAYGRALAPPAHDAAGPDFALARSLIYLRAHSLRMPPTQLARHLAIKAWKGLRENQGNEDTPAL